MVILFTLGIFSLYNVWHFKLIVPFVSSYIDILRQIVNVCNLSKKSEIGKMLSWTLMDVVRRCVRSYITDMCGHSVSLLELIIVVIVWWYNTRYIYNTERYLTTMKHSSLVSMPLTHWGWVTHICVSQLAITGSENGLSPGRRQAIIWTNAGILSIGPLWIYFIKIVRKKSYIFIQVNAFENIVRKLVAILSRLHCVKYWIDTTRHNHYW